MNFPVAYTRYLKHLQAIQWFVNNGFSNSNLLIRWIWRTIWSIVGNALEHALNVFYSRTEILALISGKHFENVQE